MPIMGGGGGGAAFNGGTITNELHITTDGSHATSLEVDDQLGAPLLVVPKNSPVQALAGGAAAANPFGIIVGFSDADTSGNPIAAFATANNYIVRIWHFGLTIENLAAPADGDLSAGQCALWFDQTNGAAKLMVKAKQANGTVVTGSVALA